MIQVQQHPASVDAYIRHGWQLVPIPPGTKGPCTYGWNQPGKTLKSQADLPPGWGIGLAHAWSSTMALDIDHWIGASPMLKEAGIDIEELYNAPDAVIIYSGRENRGKLLFQMPAGYTLASRKVVGPQGTIYELRCATSTNVTVQDVLPPTIHPDTGQPYRWAGRGHWTRLPMIPAPLLALWESMLTKDKEVNIAVNGTYDTSWDELQKAIEHITPDCSHDDWLTVGMALHWAGSQINEVDYGFVIWNEWSKGSESKYKGERDLMNRWRSFKSDKAVAVKVGSLFHLAKAHGWTRPEPDISGMFKALPPMEPSKLVIGWKPMPPEMDLSLWPAVLSKRAQEVSDSVGCDPLVPLFAGLSAICGVVDARIRLELMQGFKVPPVLWLMTLGDPADKKSPGSKPMMTILKDIELEDRPRYSDERLAWEGKEAAYGSAKKAFLEWSASPDALLGSTAPAVPDLPPAPVPVKITVSDITSQKLVRHAADRPRGLLCYLDEMNSWVRKMADKTSGEDRSAWVVSYESDRYEMDRVGAGSIHADNLAISIYGNIQPTVFRQQMSNLAADGLLQRFIPAVLNGNKTRLGNPGALNTDTQAAWENTVRLVYSLPVQTYHLDFEAFMVFREFQEWYEDAKQKERLLHTGDVFMTAFGKLEGTVGRLSLLMHVIEDPFSPYVSADIVRRVIRMTKEYLIPAYRFCFGEIGGTTSFEQWLGDYIIQWSDQSTITLSEIKRGGRRQIEHLNTWVQDQWVYTGMQTLEMAGWVMRMDDGTGEHRHQAQWGINPDLKVQFAEHRKKVIRAKQDYFDAIYNRQQAKQPSGYARPIVHGNDEVNDE